MSRTRKLALGTLSVLLMVALVLTSVVTGLGPRSTRAAGDFNVPSADYPTIQSAIDAAAAAGGGAVHVAAGTYYERITLKGGVVVLGAGQDVTAINGGGGGSVLSGEHLNTPVAVAGFTITNGAAMLGGGLYCRWDSSLIVSGCTFTNNSGSYVGGGLHCAGNCTVVLTRCTFQNNSAGWGGGLHCEWGSSLTAADCTFLDNHATESGGGMANGRSTLLLTNCVFSGNVAGGWGGGAVYNDESSATMINCTATDNTAGAGPALYSWRNATATAANCILWGGAPYTDSTSSTLITYSDIQGGYPGTGNINVEPMLTPDFHLLPGSPCIDAGDNSAVPAEVPTDFEGDPRMLDGNADSSVVVDMGADEYGLMEGDVTGDGYVTLSDSTFIRQYLLGLRTLTPAQLKCADTNDDGKVSLSDSTHIRQWLLDPDGHLGILYKPLWQSPADDDMLPPVR